MWWQQVSFYYLSGPLPHIQCHIAVNVLSALLNKTLSSFLAGMFGLMNMGFSQMLSDPFFKHPVGSGFESDLLDPFCKHPVGSGFESDWM